MNKVLVIDDEIEKVGGVLEELLEGCELIYAQSGREGLAMLTDDVGAVLLDVKMPPTVGTDREREGIESPATDAERIRAAGKNPSSAKPQSLDRLSWIPPKIPWCEDLWRDPRPELLELTEP